MVLGKVSFNLRFESGKKKWDLENNSLKSWEYAHLLMNE